VYCGKGIWPHNQEALEKLASYIIRASFSQERMKYIAAQDSIDAIAKVTYKKVGTSYIPLVKQKVLIIYLELFQ
jgi:hypothetical protein